MEEAVKLALENNLGIQIARFNPQVEDLTVAQAQAAWSPTLDEHVSEARAPTRRTTASWPAARG